MKKVQDMENLIKNTTDYLDYLISEAKLCVSVHFAKEMYPSINRSVLLAISPYIIHRNPYCIFVNEDNHSLCIENQRVMINGFVDRNPLVHTCYAGAREIVYPIFKEGKSVGFVSVNGYSAQEKPAVEYNDELWKNALDKREIPRSLTDTLIPPLQLMVENLLMFEAEEVEEINLVIRYITNHPRTASLEKIAHHFGRSKSHISHLFKTNTGKTVRAYCNELKLYGARNLLCSTDLSVTEIALESGFEDTSYFVSLFKNKYGSTPYRYKRSFKNGKTE